MRSKQTLFKYFQPVNGADLLSGAFSDLDMESSYYDLPAYPRDEVRFLSRLRKEDIMELMRQSGMISHLESLGFDELHLEMYIDKDNIYHFKLYYLEPNPDYLLINMRISESRFIPESRFFEESNQVEIYDMVVLEWLNVQNPFASFDESKPRLPGQRYPGLGSLRYLMEIMQKVGQETVKDGFMDVPDRFHTAVMYSRIFRFFNPAHEAVLRAMLRDLRRYSLADLSWGMITKTIIDESKGQPQIYDPSEQIFPVSRRMHKYFRSNKYWDKFKEVYNRKKYSFDYDLMLERKKEVLASKSPEEV